MIKILYLIVWFSFVNIFAQAINLDLKSSVKLALENNHDLKLVKLNKLQADELVTEAWGSSIFPEISGFANYRRALKRGEITIETPFFTGSFPQGTENTLSFGVNLEQPLFTGAVFLAVRVAKIYSEIAEKSVYASEAELIVNVKKAYYSALLAKEVLDLSKLTLELAEGNLEDSETLYNAGLVSEYDLIRSKVQVKNLIPQVDEAKKSVVLSENLLKYLTGIDLDNDIVLSDSLFFQKEQFNEYYILKELLFNKNYDLQQLKLQIDLRDDGVAYEFSRHFPELYFNAGWASTAQENDPRSFNQWRYKNSVYVGLNLRIPIFNGFQTTSKVQQARIDLWKAEEEFNKTSRLLDNKLREILLSLNETENRIIGYDSAIDEASLGYDLAVKRYANGLGTQLEMVDGLVSLSGARINYLSSVYEYHILKAELDQLLSNQSDFLESKN
jgi:outer membrane protein TolC